MNITNSLSASLEDYLESIFHLVKVNQVARVSEIAKDLDVKQASVTGALRVLKEKELINYQPYKFITLTQKGEKKAREINKRHRTLKNFFMNVLSANQSTAEKNACAIEHAITEELYLNLLKFSEFVDKCPIANKILTDKFKTGCSAIKAVDGKKSCMKYCAQAFLDN
ncbi:MAG: metal-dependent transcriptional regulator [Chitinispirillia bacterium]|jgi:DtxR family Mn-dependent transcriptional regulator